MIVGVDMGSAVATEKHYKLEGRKLLLVQPLDLNRTPKGDEILSVEARSRS